MLSYGSITVWLFVLQIHFRSLLYLFRFQIHVTVVDVNDETPYFPFLEYRATVSEDTARGQAVTSISAVDDDTNAQVFTEEEAMSSNPSFSFFCFDDNS